MGIFSMFKIFGKKQEAKFEMPSFEKTELGLPKSEEMKMPEIPKFEPEIAPAPAPSFEAPSYREIPAPQPQAPKDVSKDLELISAKLDTLRAMIEGLSHRLETMERKPRW
jgi:hypothetical protein